MFDKPWTDKITDKGKDTQTYRRKNQKSDQILKVRQLPNNFSDPNTEVTPLLMEPN